MRSCDRTGARPALRAPGGGGDRCQPGHRGRTGRPLRRTGDPARPVRPVGPRRPGRRRHVVAVGRRHRRRRRRRLRRGRRRPLRPDRPVGEQRRGARAHRPAGRRPTRRPSPGTSPPTCWASCTGRRRSPATCGADPAAGRWSTSRRVRPPRRTGAGPPYCASKAAVEMLTEVVGLEEQRRRTVGVRRGARCRRHRHAGADPVHARRRRSPTSGGSAGWHDEGAFATPAWVARWILERCVDPATRLAPDAGRGSVASGSPTRVGAWA